MSFRAMQRFAAGLLISGCLAASAGPAWGQEEINRKVKIRTAAIYPELARRMSITGVVKVQITVATNGVVKNVKAGGGTPGAGQRRAGRGQDVAVRGEQRRDHRNRGVSI